MEWYVAAITRAALFVFETNMNFDSVKFTADIMKAFFKSLCGNADKYRLDGNELDKKVIEFCSDMEVLANNSAVSPIDFGPINPKMK